MQPCNYKYKISPSTNDLSHTKYSKKYRSKHYARSTLLLTSFRNPALTRHTFLKEDGYLVSPR